MAREIIKGSDDLLKVYLRTSKTLVPLDLTGNTEITACFIKDDSTALELTKTASDIAVVGDEKLGYIEITLNDTNTALLMAGEKLSFNVKVDYGTDRKIIDFKQSIDVSELIC